MMFFYFRDEKMKESVTKLNKNEVCCISGGAGILTMNATIILAAGFIIGFIAKKILDRVSATAVQIGEVIALGTITSGTTTYFIYSICYS